MTLEELGEYAESLGCVRRGRDGRVGWYVDNRLVVREDEPGTLCIRVSFADRERPARTRSGSRLPGSDT